MNILARVDVSEEIGFGHIYRTIRISKYFKPKKIIFLINSSNEKIYKVLKKKKINFKIIKSKKKNKNIEKIDDKNLQILDAKETLKIANQNNIKLILIDDYKKDYLWHKVIIDNKIYLVVIDDLNNKKVLCDTYINISKERAQIKKNLLLKKTQIICGNKNNPFLLKKIEKKFFTEVKIIHVSLSSAVKKNIILTIIKTLNTFQKYKKHGQKLKVNIFSTSYNFSTFKKLNFNSLNIKYFNNSGQYKSNMIKSDLGIGFAGMSMFDRMSFLLPSLNFSISKNQDIGLKDKYLRKLMCAGTLEKKYSTNKQIKKKIEIFLKNEKLRKKIFNNLNKLPKKTNFNFNIKLRKIINEIKYY